MRPDTGAIRGRPKPFVDKFNEDITELRDALEAAHASLDAAEVCLRKLHEWSLQTEDAGGFVLVVRERTAPFTAKKGEQA